MKRYAFATAVLLLVVCPWRQAPQADTTQYTVEALGNLVNIDGLVPAETGINASGEIVGTVSGALGTRAVRYTDGIGWEYVPGLTWGSTATGINVHGDIVGSRSVTGHDHAYRFNGGSGIIEDIGLLPGGTFTEGGGINDNADVVGYGDNNGAQLAFRASPGQSPVVLPNLGGGFAQACGINNAGAVVMTSFTASFLEHAALLEADGVALDDAGSFDGVNAGFSMGCAIDELGRIGGFASANSFAVFHAFNFDGHTLVSVDGNLPSSFSNIESMANGASAGWYVSTVDGQQHAMLYTAVNGAVDLSTLLPANSGWSSLVQVKGINASGQMVGDGVFNGKPTVFRMSPAAAKDTTPPVIAPHGDVTAEATGPDGASVAYSAPATTDAVDGTGTATCAPASGSTFALGTTTVTCTATDAAGNVATPTTFNVVVKDTTAPVIAAHGDVTAEATGPSGASVAYSAPATTDAVDGSRTATCAPASGSTFPLGTTTVTCTATDAAGNAATPTTFNVLVKDTTAPVISSIYASPDTVWPPNGKMVPVSVTVSATDHVDPSPSCALTSISGGGAGSSAITGQFSGSVRADAGAAYVLTVTCSDASGNKSSASAVVSVTKTNGNTGNPKANVKSGR